MVTVADVVEWAHLESPAPESAEHAALERTLAAVVEYITDRYQVHDPLTDSEETAVIMQTAALWRRRISIDGVAAFGDFGPIRVTALDPHVRMMLIERTAFG